MGLYYTYMGERSYCQQKITPPCPLPPSISLPTPPDCISPHICVSLTYQSWCYLQNSKNCPQHTSRTHRSYGCTTHEEPTPPLKGLPFLCLPGEGCIVDVFPVSNEFTLSCQHPVGSPFQLPSPVFWNDCFKTPVFNNVESKCEYSANFEWNFYSWYIKIAKISQLTEICCYASHFLDKISND